jgi:hypothetical protein
MGVEEGASMDTSQSVRLEGAPSTRKKRRTIPIVDARFQWKYTLIITALGAGITAIMGAFLFRAHNDNTRLLDLDQNPQLTEQVVHGDQIFLLYLIVLVVVMGLALAFWGLVVTHRVSGPLYVIARYFGELADGRYPDLRPLRRHDELQEFFGSFEDAVTGLRSRDESTLVLIDETLERLRVGEPSTRLEVAVTALEKVRRTLLESMGGERR